MKEKILGVRLLDLNKMNIGKGILLSINKNTIIIKGNNLPVLNSGINIYIYIYDDFVGINPYLCMVSVASKQQLTGQIIRKETIIERRKNLKIRTDLYFYVNRIFRESEDITDKVKVIKINVLNLSVGGMLISSNFEFLMNDEFTFYFKYINYKPIHLEAKIIRIDEIEDPDGIKDRISYNYGCCFNGILPADEAIILKYLFERQLQLYRNKYK